MNSHIYKVILAILISILPNSVAATTSIVTWTPPAGGLKNTYSDSKTFTANKGDVLSLKCTGTISSGSSVYVYLKLNGTNKELLSHTSPNFSFTETSFVEIPDDGDYTISYTYKHNGGGTAYSIKIYANLISPSDGDYTYSLTNGEEFHKDGFHYKYDGSQLSVCSCKIYNYTGDIIFPSSITYRGYEYEIGAISSSAFKNCTDIQSIKFDNPTISIGEYAFMGCTNLRTVNLPLEMTYLQPGIFSGCTSLSEIDIHNITDIAYRVFENCSSLKDIQFSKELTTIGASAFTGCAITEVTFPNSLMSVGSKAFYKCPALNNIVLGNGINELGEYAFQYCTGLESVSIGKSLENIGNAFYESSNIKYLTYLEGCEKTIPTGFKNVVTVNLPESLTEISDGTFSGFEKITSIELPASILRIGEGAFSSCKGLSGKVIIPNNVKAIAKNAFHLCSKISDVTIGDNVETIDDYAFYWCSSLRSISFGNKLMSIGEEAFNDCRMSSIEFKEGLKIIGRNAFVNCSELVTLKLPSTMERIEEYAFRNCTQLSNVDFGNGIKYIGDHAFCGCNSMTSLKLPDSLISIGESAFTGSDYGTGNHIFSTVQIGNGLKEITDVFWGMNHNQPKIESFVIGTGIESIHDYTPIFGSSYTDSWGKPKSYLLTNNKVDLYSWAYSGNNPNKPNCDIYVADASKYTDDEIKKYGIKNIISSTTFNGEYSGNMPNINLTSSLNGYDVIISKDYYNAGTYTSMNVTFSKDDFSSTISVPCNYTIAKAPLIVTPYDATITYGDNLPEFNCFYQGLKNSETPNEALSKLPSVTTNAHNGADAGEYKLYASGAESKNYSLSYNNGTLTIKPAQQTIEWNQSFDNIVSDSKFELQATSSCGLKAQYSSSDPTIAYVSEEGGKTYLYTRKDGTIILTASQPGNKNYEAATNVEKTIIITPRMATGISLSRTDIDMKVGDEYTLVVTVTPETTIDKTVDWSSSDNTIASVSNGVIHALKLGETTIQAKTKDGSNLTASCRVNVIPTMVESISLSKSEVQLILGNSERIFATILPANATNKAINWEVENPNIASVNDGLITALGIGNTIVKAIATDGSEIFAICSVIVNPISISSIELSPSSAAINVGESLTLAATILPSNASNQQLLWQSSDNDVASVANGVVIGKRPGNVIITAQSTDGSNKSAMASIKVNDILASNIYLDKSSISMFVGDEDVLVATITPMDVTNNGIIWSTTNSAVATVKDGHVVAKGFGSATITATTTDGTDFSARCQISVDKRSQSISWSQTFYNVVYGGQLIELSAKSSSGLKIKYKSNDESIVSIFDLGDVVYLNPGNCGKTSIIAYQEGNYEYYPSAEYQKEVEVVNSSTSSTKALVAYYTQSSLIDGIVAELANQIVSISGSVYTAKVEPVNDRINDAATNYIVRDSLMSIISSNPNNVASYPDIKPMSFDINDYDIVIMVYPLWNDAMAAPMQTFRMIYQHSYKNKEVGYVEYDEVNNSDASSNSKILRICSNDIENVNEVISDWLNNNDPSGIKVIRSQNNTRKRGIYDLQGRKLKSPSHGVYIEDGVKVIKKQ